MKERIRAAWGRYGCGADIWGAGTLVWRILSRVRSVCVRQVIDCTSYVQVQQLVEGGASELNGVREGDVLLRIVRLIAI